MPKPPKMQCRAQLFDAQGNRSVVLVPVLTSGSIPEVSEIIRYRGANYVLVSTTPLTYEYRRTTSAVEE